MASTRQNPSRWKEKEKVIAAQYNKTTVSHIRAEITKHSTATLTSDPRSSFPFHPSCQAPSPPKHGDWPFLPNRKAVSQFLLGTCMTASHSFQKSSSGGLDLAKLYSRNSLVVVSRNPIYATLSRCRRAEEGSRASYACSTLVSHISESAREGGQTPGNESLINCHPPPATASLRVSR